MKKNTQATNRAHAGTHPLRHYRITPNGLRLVRVEEVEDAPMDRENPYATLACRNAEDLARREAETEAFENLVDNACEQGC